MPDEIGTSNESVAGLALKRQRDLVRKKFLLQLGANFECCFSHASASRIETLQAVAARKLPSCQFYASKLRKKLFSIKFAWQSGKVKFMFTVGKPL
jgi:hypothetical protein